MNILGIIGKTMVSQGVRGVRNAHALPYKLPELLGGTIFYAVIISKFFGGL